MGYIMKQDGCVPFELTKDEYDSFRAILLQNRVGKLENEIRSLADLHGVEATKTIVRNLLKKL